MNEKKGRSLEVNELVRECIRHALALCQQFCLAHPALCTTYIVMHFTIDYLYAKLLIIYFPLPPAVELNY